MVFSILSGAYKNSGDYLIVERCLDLIKFVYPDSEFVIYERCNKIDNYIEKINQTDALIFAGGPAYLPDVYPNQIPLTDDLDKISIPIFTIGLGWYGVNTLPRTIYEDYKFSEKTKHLFEFIAQYGELSCRDWYSTKILRVNGIINSVMTGCPAWYDIKNNNIYKKDLRNNISQFKNICISDFAQSVNQDLSLAIVDYIINKFPDANVKYVFHRGIPESECCSKKFIDELETRKVTIVDISGSSEGFHVYDDCDLHIGMRVHAHIYNLSIRNISILIEEDGRGTGANETLGLFSIKAYRQNDIVSGCSKRFRDRVLRKVIDILLKSNHFNENVICEIDHYLNILRKTDYKLIKRSFELQLYYFENMIDHIKKFEKIIKDRKK